MKFFKLIFWTLFTLAFLVTAVSLIGANADRVTVKIFHYESADYPLWAVLLTTLFIGALLSAIFFIVEIIVLETRNIRLRRAHQKLERALQGLSAKGEPGAPTLNVTPNALPSRIDESDV